MKKSITIIIICFTVVCSIFQSGCEEDRPNCPDIKDLNLGKVLLSDSLNTYISSLMNKNKAVYKDSLGKETIFTIEINSKFEHIEYPEASSSGNCRNPLIIQEVENRIINLFSNDLDINIKIDCNSITKTRNEPKEEYIYIFLNKELLNKS